MRLEIEIQKRLAGFDLDAELSSDSRVLALFGPSGSGKSLTIQCIAGIARPNRGRIVVDGETLFDSEAKIDLPPQMRGVGYVPQSYALFPHLTVAENVAFGLHDLDRKDASRRVGELLDMLRLSELGDRYPRRLSGGQQQRVALARALATGPRVLLLDEPFSALDSPIRGRLHAELLQVLKRLNVTTVLVTHDLLEAYTLSETMAVFDSGRVLQVGPRDEVLHRPASRAVARFTATKNIFRGRVESNRPDRLEIRAGNAIVVTKPGPHAAGETVDFCIRPEDVMLVRPERAVGEQVEENQYPGSIVGEIARGTSFTLQVKLDGDPLQSGRDFDLHVDIPANVYYRLGLDESKQWLISLKRQAVHVIGRVQERQRGG